MSKLAEIIAKEVASTGVIPFARFMELALYCPDYGFYEKERDNIGARGDYFTSVSVGPLFGELLAFQFAEWLGETRERGGGRMGKEDLRLQIVEGGAHDGRLAVDVMTWVRDHRPDLFSRLEYHVVEPSPRRKGWQQKMLSPFTPRVHWLSSPCSLPASPGVRRIIFSNEMLDAMPVHRLGWDAKAKRWFEWGITLDTERFVWAGMSPDLLKPALADHASGITHHALCDGFTLDICPAAEAWWGAAARSLASGKLLTFDYGLTAEELVAPERRDGTLRAYRRQQLSADVLSNPGEQDLTAHVNFTALQEAGEAVGLQTECCDTQERFLMRIVEALSRTEPTLRTWTESQKRQLQTLTHPNFMGRQFRVMIQSRG